MAKRAKWCREQTGPENIRVQGADWSIKQTGEENKLVPRSDCAKQTGVEIIWFRKLTGIEKTDWYRESRLV